MDCGANPCAAWDYTPGELAELIRGYEQRQEHLGYFGFNLAQCIASMCFGRRPEPWQAFPWQIEYRAMTDEEIWSALSAWTGGVQECEPES